MTADYFLILNGICHKILPPYPYNMLEWIRGTFYVLVKMGKSDHIGDDDVHSDSLRD